MIITLFQKSININIDIKDQESVSDTLSLDKSRNEIVDFHYDGHKELQYVTVNDLSTVSRQHIRPGPSFTKPPLERSFLSKR